MAVRSYDPKEVSVIVGGRIIEGFADGQFINATRNNDQFAINMGADGSGARAKSNDRSGRVEMVLQQTSPSNDVLSAFAASDELSNGGVVSVIVRDALGTTLIAAETAWIVKYPDAPFSKSVENRTWILETDNLEMFVGSNPEQ